MHFNENVNRPQAMNQQGEPMYSVSLAKNRRGEGVAKEVKVKQSFSMYNFTLYYLHAVLRGCFFFTFIPNYM